MRLHALLSFYDEPIPSLLTAISSLRDAGVDHLVAVDGAYALYPDGKGSSDPNQHAAIVLACRELDMGCTLHVPAAVWAGNEPEKRTALFALAWAGAQDGDWFMVHDADMVVTKAPDDLRGRLAATEHDVAKVEILDVVALRAQQRDWPPYFEFCGLFRAQPITVGPHHATYTSADGRKLWVGNDRDPEVGVLDLTDDVLVEHRPDQRPNERQLAKLAYYRNRDEALVERGDCSLCENRSVALVPTRWRWTEIGPVADWAEACESCGRQIDAVNTVELTAMGIDPASVVTENRNGRPPSRVSAPLGGARG